jgi:hypothetical protein
MSKEAFERWLFGVIWAFENATAVEPGEDFHPVVNEIMDRPMPYSVQTIGEWYDDMLHIWLEDALSGEADDE